MANKHQFGVSEESTYGTYVVPARAFEILPGESLERQNSVINSEGLRPGLRNKLGSRRVLTRQSGAGSIAMEVATTGMGIWFKHMLGAVDTTQPDVGGAPTVYQHDFTPGDLDGLSLTIEKGIEAQDGTVLPFTFLGCKIPGWEFTIDNDGILQVSLEVDAQDVDTGQTLASLTYDPLSLFHFAQGTLKVDAAPVATVSQASISGTNPMNVERFFLGNSGVKDEPLENDFRTLTGSLTAEFEDLATFYDRFAADTTASLELEFLGAIIEDVQVETLTITLDDVRFTGDTPKIEGPTYSMQNAPFEAYETDGGASITVSYICTDTTP